MTPIEGRQGLLPRWRIVRLCLVDISIHATDSYKTTYTACSEVEADEFHTQKRVGSNGSRLLSIPLISRGALTKSVINLILELGFQTLGRALDKLVKILKIHVNATRCAKKGGTLTDSRLFNCCCNNRSSRVFCSRVRLAPVPSFTAQSANEFSS